jgi:hypothetical protein
MIGSKTTVVNPKTIFLGYNNELSIREGSERIVRKMLAEVDDE